MSKIKIQNFRSHENTTIKLSDNNILIGKNNSGKTSFLDAINYAIGLNRRFPSEDDFYAGTEYSDPKYSKPIKVILEFKESNTKRFSEKEEFWFDKAIQFDEDEFPDDPIKFVRLQYEFKYIKEKGRYEDNRFFLDRNNKKITNFPFKRIHASFFPFLYLRTSRDINKELHNKSSFWGNLKKSIDYKDKEEDIKKLIEQLNDLILNNDKTAEEIITKLEEFEDNISATPSSLYLQAFSKRSWELINDLNIYLKTSNSKLALPISKHGMGTQNIAVLLIFNAYLDILLPKLVDNDETVPIIGIEEPEAHIHPQAQRSVFQQLTRINGQKIISTHSPFIVDQADIYDYIIFNTHNGTTEIKKIPKYKERFKFRYGLPEKAYENNEYLKPDEKRLIERYVKYKNSELFFSSLFILFEGESEKIFLKMIFPYKTGKTPGQLGISLINCEGRNYSPFLKLSNENVFNLKWLILSDAELDTKNTLKSSIKNCGYDYDEVLKKGILTFLPDGNDFESYYISYYGTSIMQKIISEEYGKDAFKNFKKDLKTKLPLDGKNSIKDFSEEELINKFIDQKGKVKFAEILSLFIINNSLKIPTKLYDLIIKAKEELNDI